MQYETRLCLLHINDIGSSGVIADAAAGIAAARFHLADVIRRDQTGDPSHPAPNGSARARAPTGLIQRGHAFHGRENEEQEIEVPSPGARINRVVAMLSNDELKILKRIAREKKLPLGTAAYEIIARALKRSK
jgi:hypothetical protein